MHLDCDQFPDDLEKYKWNTHQKEGDMSLTLRSEDFFK